MNIAVIGSGYVGLVTSTCLADSGNIVACVDIDSKKIAQLQEGKITIYEPRLESLFLRNVEQKNLFFTTSLEEGIRDAEIIFLALPTPPDADGFADLKYILQVAKELGPLLTRYVVVVDKSTVPVGTADKVREVIAQNTKVSFDVVSNPEFLREGYAVEDFLKPERIIIGASSKKAFKMMRKLYRPFLRQGNPLVEMDEKSAELTKYAANSFLATKITFMNEVANMCEKVGANVDKVRLGIGSDSRIGKRFLFPGIGYGGSCFPKDILAMYQSAKKVGYEFQLLETVLKVNDLQKKILVQKIEDVFKLDLKGKTVACWGLAFKPDTDDIRDAPSLEIIKTLLEKDVKIQVFDPEAMPNVKAKLGDTIIYATDMYKALEGADFLIICTEWNIFKNPNLDKVKSLLQLPYIFDGRNIFDPQDMEALGFKYWSIGR